MIGAFFFVLSFLILGLFFGIFRKSTYYGATGRFGVVSLWRLITVLIISLLVAMIVPIEVERIDAGHVGIKVSNIGDNRGVGKTEYVTGWVFYNSWISRIYEFPIHQQHIDYEEADIVTRGGFRATIKPSFNYSINPGNSTLR